MCIRDSYFRLRDIGRLVGFGVEWNAAEHTVEISTARTVPDGSGLTDTAVSGAQARISEQKITVDGETVSMTAYQIGGNNYVKLRDIGRKVGFGVGYDSASRRILISPAEPCPEEGGAPSAAAAVWDGTMRYFHEAMVGCNWDTAAYLKVAEQYAPAITGKADGTVQDVIGVLENIRGAPVDAVSFDDQPVSLFWAKELRIALGEQASGEHDHNSGNTPDGSLPVTNEMLRAWELEMVDRIRCV